MTSTVQPSPTGDERQWSHEYDDLAVAQLAEELADARQRCRTVRETERRRSAQSRLTAFVGDIEGVPTADDFKPV